MLLPSFHLDLLNLIFLPLMVITIIDLVKNWRSVWDNKLTSKDRFILQKTVIFLIMPVIVYCHEMGHAITITHFGGKVAEFHYGLFWGFVVPEGHFTPEETVWTYFAGNAVQIVIGLIAGLIALVVTTPPMVALFVYTALWAVGGTVVIYALMSATGFYGDWSNIYTAPTPHLIAIIGTIHFLLVSLVVFCLYGKLPRLWYVMRTKPEWAKHTGLLALQAQTSPTAENYLLLAQAYAGESLYGQAQKYLLKAEELGTQVASCQLLKAAMTLNKNQFQEASQLCEQIADNKDFTKLERVKALMILADGYVRQNNPPKAIETYSRATALDNHLGDARLYKLLLLKQTGKKLESETELAELDTLDNCHWLDPSLDRYFQEMKHS